jgi:sucrose-6F-phosphate phosphohydrolase
MQGWPWDCCYGGSWIAWCRWPTIVVRSSRRGAAPRRRCHHPSSNGMGWGEPMHTDERQHPPSHQRPRWLLVSDIDDTFTGDDDATRRLIELHRANPQLCIALNSSRPLNSVLNTIAAFPLGWKPCATITAMGTELTIGGVRDEAWTHRFDGWRRGPFDQLARRMGWVPHPPIYQTAFKASFGLPAHTEINAVRKAIADVGIPSICVISGHGEVDILPPGAGKGPATAQLTERLAIPLERVIVAGDSGNDVAMFEAVRRGIVVGNARDELRLALGEGDFYFAQGACAGGIIQGLQHFGAISCAATQGPET